MQPKQRRRQIRQRQLRRKKNVSFTTLSVQEKQKINEQESNAKYGNWHGYEERDRHQVEDYHGISFSEIIGKLKERFPRKIIQILDEGAGRSSLKAELLSDFGSSIDVITSDVRKYDERSGWPDKQANIMDLTKAFGKGRFHLIVSTYGGVFHSPLQEKALFQMVLALKIGGMGIVYTTVSERRLAELEKRWNISIIKRNLNRIIFIKNSPKRKK